MRFKLIELRRMTGLNPTDFARQLSLDPRMYIDTELGKYTPDKETKIKIMSALDSELNMKDIFKREW